MPYTCMHLHVCMTHACVRLCAVSACLRVHAQYTTPYNTLYNTHPHIPTGGLGHRPLQRKIIIFPLFRGPQSHLARRTTTLLHCPLPLLVLGIDSSAASESSLLALQACIVRFLCLCHLLCILLCLLRGNGTSRNVVQRVIRGLVSRCSRCVSSSWQVIIVLSQLYGTCKQLWDA